MEKGANKGKYAGNRKVTEIPRVSEKVRGYVDWLFDRQRQARDVYDCDDEKYVVARNFMFKDLGYRNKPLLEFIAEYKEYPEQQKGMLKVLMALTRQEHVKDSCMPLVSEDRIEASREYFGNMWKREQKANVYGKQDGFYRKHVQGLVERLEKENPELLEIIKEIDEDIYNPTKSLGALLLVNILYDQKDTEEIFDENPKFFFDLFPYSGKGEMPKIPLGEIKNDHEARIVGEIRQERAKKEFQKGLEEKGLDKTIEELRRDVKRDIGNVYPKENED